MADRIKGADSPMSGEVQYELLRAQLEGLDRTISNKTVELRDLDLEKLSLGELRAELKKLNKLSDRLETAGMEYASFGIMNPNSDYTNAIYFLDSAVDAVVDAIVGFRRIEK